jgi:hypothetical protein
MRKELNEARKALGKGRADESLVHLWNVLEPARMSGDRRTLGAIAQLAIEIRERGEPVEQREAERLLEEVRETVEEEEAGAEAEPVVALPSSANGDGFVTEGEAAGEIEEEQEGRGGRLSQWLVPLIFLIIIVVNIVARYTGD